MNEITNESQVHTASYDKVGFDSAKNFDQGYSRTLDQSGSYPVKNANSHRIIGGLDGISVGQTIEGLGTTIVIIGAVAFVAYLLMKRK